MNSTTPNSNLRTGRTRSIRRLLQIGMDRAEPAVEWTIRLCGWSAIVFVFAIFIFVFSEGVPIFFAKEQIAKVASDGPYNDLVFRAASGAEEFEGAELVFRKKPGQAASLAYDAAFRKLTIDYDPGVSTAQDVVAAAEANEELAASMTVFSEPADFPAEGGKPRNDGSGPLAPREGVTAMTSQSTLTLGSFFGSRHWRPTSYYNPQYGILTLLVGTASVTVLAMVLAVPLGLGAAVYVSEFCSGKWKETLKVVIELLAAIPSVVWGFVGIMVLSPIILSLTNASSGINLLNGGIILALMSVPIIVSVGEDALKAVPDSYREAAISMGANRWEIVYRVLFPAAKNGLLAAVLLGVGRAIGETMAVLMATGHADSIPRSLVDPVCTLTATIAAELGEAPKGGDHYRVLFVIGILLFVIAMFVNLVADLVVKGTRGNQNA